MLKDLASFLKEIDRVAVSIRRELVRVAENALDRGAVADHANIF
jgi:hypothetical protein